MQLFTGYEAQLHLIKCRRPDSISHVIKDQNEKAKSVLKQVQYLSQCTGLQ